MRLLHSPTSPYARKVMACAIARGVEGGIELVPTNPHESPAALLAVNPLSRIPVLVLEDGTAIHDSPVICDYLDTVGDAPPLMPAAGAARVRAATMQSVADGILDAAVPRRSQIPLPQDEGRAALDARRKSVVAWAVDALEKAPPEGLSDTGAIATACALGYLDFRYAGEPWRDGHPRLAAWYEGVKDLPPIARTAPPPA